MKKTHHLNTKSIERLKISKNLLLNNEEIIRFYLQIVL